MIEKFIRVQHEIHGEKKPNENLKLDDASPVKARSINLEPNHMQNSLSTSRMHSTPIELLFLNSPAFSDRSTAIPQSQSYEDQLIPIKHIIKYKKVKNERVVTYKKFKEFQDNVFKNLHEAVQEAKLEKQKPVIVEEPPETYNFVSLKLPPIESPRVPLITINEDSKLEDYFTTPDSKNPKKRSSNLKLDLKAQHAKRLVGSLNLTKVLDHISFSDTKNHSKNISKDPFLYSLESEIMKLRAKTDMTPHRNLFDIQPSFERGNQSIEVQK